MSTLVQRSLLLTFRGLDPVTDLLYWPLYDIIVWGFAFAWMGKVTQDTQATLIVLCSLVLWQAVSRVSLDISFNFLSEMWARNVLNFFVTPLTLIEWMLSVMVSGVLTAAMGALVGITAIWLLYGINVLSVGIFLLPLFGLLIISGWSIGFAATAVLVVIGPRAQKVVWIAAWFFGPYIGVFYPVEQLPLWAQMIGYSVPMTYVFKSLRIYISTGVIAWDLLGYATLLSGICFLVVTQLLQYFFERSRNVGLARLEDA